MLIFKLLTIKISLTKTVSLNGLNKTKNKLNFQKWKFSFKMNRSKTIQKALKMKLIVLIIEVQTKKSQLYLKITTMSIQIAIIQESVHSSEVIQNSQQMTSTKNKQASIWSIDPIAVMIRMISNQLSLILIAITGSTILSISNNRFSSFKVN